MIRLLHRWPGLLALALVTVLALSGAALSVFPAAERLGVTQPEAGLSVADLAQRVQSAIPAVEQIVRAPSGQITAYWFDGGTPGSAVIDPSTGQGIGSADPNQAERWLINLHRALFLGDGGRIVTAAGALAMLLLALSGMMLVTRRAGGWRRWFTRLRGPLAGRLHVEIARVAVIGLLVSSATALWMTASTFDLLPDSAVPPTTLAEPSGKTGIAVKAIGQLQQTPVSALRELSFPYADDASDVFTLTTETGTATLDQGTGVQLSWAGLSMWQRVSATIYMLHTGQGAAALGLLLGLMALGVPVMGGTGVMLWLAGRHARPKIKGNVTPAQAETILLVGSEGGSTWGFAATLHAALTAAGQTVHAAPLSSFDPVRYAKAQRILIMTATYGDGDAPTSAKGFLERLSQADVPAASLAVLGFGDRSFPAFCAFAKTIAAEAEAKGYIMLIPFDTVDRQSPQDFARWGQALGAALDMPLRLAHQPILPETQRLSLLSRRDYGTEVQAPTSILRFAVPNATLWQRLIGRGISRFQAGDLLGILPQGADVPRFYSLASASRDGFVEIVVRKQAGGLCSGQLLALEPGDTTRAFLRRNPNFHAGRDRAPLILIGAGTGVGPLAGIIRDNRRLRPIHLFFGIRHPDSDFLYGAELAAWQAKGRLASLITAVSRGSKPQYVQDSLRGEAAQIANLIRDGARVMVCGGREMAVGVADALAEIIAPLGLTPAALKAEGRYVEDVY
ncbi:PepSY domain-containing protein [Cypionkella sp.]|uniref:PepSY domain-containing protein n=1 Tax=Cypionkella sp. TaxID=2811411 RepID=UPI002AB97607|nr:PepSY domain-containing protein [Cypionkella sp.]MDZ4391940.1 PepSY domain-containing protein [Cypionkella sp.]